MFILYYLKCVFVSFFAMEKHVKVNVNKIFHLSRNRKNYRICVTLLKGLPYNRHSWHIARICNQCMTDGVRLLWSQYYNSILQLVYYNKVTVALALYCDTSSALLDWPCCLWKLIWYWCHILWICHHCLSWSNFFNIKQKWNVYFGVKCGWCIYWKLKLS